MCSSCHRLFRVYLARCNLWYKDTGDKLKEKTTQSDSVQPGVDSPSAPFSPNISFICFSVDGGGEHHLKSSTASHRLSAGFRSCNSRVHSIWVTPYSYSPNHSVSLRVLWMGELLSWRTPHPSLEMFYRSRLLRGHVDLKPQHSSQRKTGSPHLIVHIALQCE